MRATSKWLWVITSAISALVIVAVLPHGGKKPTLGNDSRKLTPLPLSIAHIQEQKAHAFLKASADKRDEDEKTSELRRLVISLHDGDRRRNCEVSIHALQSIRAQLVPSSDPWETAVRNEAACLHLLHEQEMYVSLSEYAYALSPDSSAIRLDLANAYASSGRCDRAIPLLEKAIDHLDEWSLDTLVRCQRKELGGGRLKHGSDGAIVSNSLRRAVDVASGGHRAFLQMELARELARVGNFEDAMKFGAEAYSYAVSPVGSTDLSYDGAQHIIFEWGALLYDGGQRELGLAYMQQAISQAASQDLATALSSRLGSVLEGGTGVPSAPYLVLGNS